MFLRQIYDPTLSQYAYLIGCQRTGEALVIDPERDIDRYETIASENGLRITAVTETHIHADFVSGAREFADSRHGVTVYLSDMGDADWKYTWASKHPDCALVVEGDRIKVGNIQITVLHTPGHTPEHLSFLIEDQGGGANEPIAIATGDFVFVGDVGRPDLLETAAGEAGSREPAARALYRSLLTFQELPDFIQILPGHGAGSACGKALGAVPTSTAGYERRFNPAITTALHDGEQAFVDFILEGQPEPPPYFARMKRVNKDGPALLGKIPQPPKVDAATLAYACRENQQVVIDTSRPRHEFMAQHLDRSLFAPMGDKLALTVGSYVAPDSEIFLLLADEAELDPALRTLLRIGYDRIAGYAVYDQVADDPAFEAACTSITVHHTSEIEELTRSYDESIILDVRSAVEFAEEALPGALNHAYTRLAKHLDEFPHRKIIVHCGSGLRAALAVPFLRQQGVDAIYCDGNFPRRKDTGFMQAEKDVEAGQSSGGEDSPMAGGERASFSI